MKVLDHFNDFLKDEVNLNQTRIGSLETSIDVIEAYIDGSEWAAIIIDWVPQGSWVHKTIIKPVDKGEFDADLLVYVDPVEGVGGQRLRQRPLRSVPRQRHLPRHSPALVALRHRDLRQ